MSDHKPLPIAGYTEQSADKIELVNALKEMEEYVLRVLDEMGKYGIPTDKRWLAIGRNHIEQGFMAVNRSVFRPQRVNLDG